MSALVALKPAVRGSRDSHLFFDGRPPAVHAVQGLGVLRRDGLQRNDAKWIAHNRRIDNHSDGSQFTFAHPSGVRQTARFLGILRGCVIASITLLAVLKPTCIDPPLGDATRSCTV